MVVLRVCVRVCMCTCAGVCIYMYVKGHSGSKEKTETSGAEIRRLRQLKMAGALGERRQGQQHRKAQGRGLQSGPSGMCGGHHEAWGRQPSSPGGAT